MERSSNYGIIELIILLSASIVFLSNKFNIINGLCFFIICIGSGIIHKKLQESTKNNKIK